MLRKLQISKKSDQESKKEAKFLPEVDKTKFINQLQTLYDIAKLNPHADLKAIIQELPVSTLLKIEEQILHAPVPRVESAYDIHALIKNHLSSDAMREKFKRICADVISTIEDIKPFINAIKNITDIKKIETHTSYRDISKKIPES